MFCKYCGKQIPDQSEFCPECGKGLKSKKEEVKETAKQPVSLPLILMVLLVCGNTVYFWGKVLLYGYGTTIFTLFETVVLLAGMIIWLRFVSSGKIKASAYQFTDLLPLACAWGPLSGLLVKQQGNFIWSYGSWVSEGIYAAECYVNQVILLSGLWICLALAALGLGRTGRWNPGKKHKLILTAVLALCTVIGILFVNPAMMSQNVSMESIATGLYAGRIWCAFSWLWPLAILKTFRKLGSGQITAVGALIALLGIKVGRWILLVICLPILNLGAGGVGLAYGLAPAFALLLLPVVKKVKIGKK